MRSKKLESALKTIRKECNEQSDCNVCPMRGNDDECNIVMRIPRRWVLASDMDNSTRRLFK